MKDDPFDVCECGDYRHQHDRAHGGACGVCRHSYQPWPPCQRFRFSRTDPGPSTMPAEYAERVRRDWRSTHE